MQIAVLRLYCDLGALLTNHAVAPPVRSATKAIETDDIKNNKRYAGLDGFTIEEVAAKVGADYGKIDILVHSLANGPEVTKPLLETSRSGYLAASSASAYSMVSLVQKFGPIMNEGGSVISLTYIASE